MASTRSTTRLLLQATRASRRSPIVHPRSTLRIPQRRFASSDTTTSSSSTSSSSPGSAVAVIGGIAGGGLVFLISYGWYRMSGAKTAVDGMHSAKKYYEQATSKLQANAPEPNEAMKWLRETAQSYAAFVPGGRRYVDAALDDLDAVQQKHGGEVERIIKETYDELKDVTKKHGASVQGASEAWQVLEKRLKEIGSLAGDAAEQIMDNHPKLKEQVGGNVDQLRDMAKQYGPQAQEQVDKTWDQIKSIASKGISADSINEIRKVVDEKKQLLQQWGDEAYNKAMEQAKPYLDKAPQVKEKIEQKADVLKKTDVSSLTDYIKDAVDSGSTEKLENFLNDASSKASGSSGGGMGFGGIESYLKQIPGGEEIMPKLQQLISVGQKHGKDAEDLLKSTISEIKDVLHRKAGDAEKIAQQAKDQSPSPSS